MWKTRFGSQEVILCGIKTFFFQDTFMARETLPSFVANAI